MDRPFAAALFLADYGIPQGTPSREFHNTICPFCGGSPTSPFPLGIHVSKGYASCWRCQSHPLLETIAALTATTPKEAREILAAYSFTSHVPGPKLPSSKVRHCQPPGGPLTAPYSRYLESRGFDPDWIALEHGVLAAGSKCFWDAGVPLDGDWKGQWFSDRLIIPIHDATGRLVNFQGRWIRKEKERWGIIRTMENGKPVETPGWVPIERYKGARVDKVPMHHKHLLYGAHRGRSDLAVVVEGVLDQWKLGRGSVATFGTSLTIHQIRLLGAYRRVLFCFDSEDTAQAKAARWAREVAALGVSVEVVDLELGTRDPGDLTDSEAAAVRRELGLD